MKITVSNTTGAALSLYSHSSVPGIPGSIADGASGSFNVDVPGPKAFANFGLTSNSNQWVLIWWEGAGGADASARGIIEGKEGRENAGLAVNVTKGSVETTVVISLLVVTITITNGSPKELKLSSATKGAKSIFPASIAVGATKTVVLKLPAPPVGFANYVFGDNKQQWVTVYWDATAVHGESNRGKNEVRKLLAADVASTLSSDGTQLSGSVIITQPKPGRPAFYPTPVASGESNNTVSTASLPNLKLRLQDPKGDVLANTEYSVTWDPPNGDTYYATTAADGIVTEPVPPGTKGATITCSGKKDGKEDACPPWSVYATFISFTLPTVGYIPNVNEPMERRLSNLGFLPQFSLDDALIQYRAWRLHFKVPQTWVGDDDRTNLTNEIVSRHDT